MSKRTLDTFFTPAGKKPRTSTDPASVNPFNSSQPLSESSEWTVHLSYPWGIPHPPPEISATISRLPKKAGKPITNQPHLNLLYYQPFIPQPTSHALFIFLRRTLFFHRVAYTIKRFGTETRVQTPRYTTVFGVDGTSIFQGPDHTLVSSTPPQHPIPKGKYKQIPRPIPECLDLLRRVTEVATDTIYNFCLVNYYANGNDSISYHSDDEYFLERNPAIASFTLGATRDFLMKHKPSKEGEKPVESTPIKLPLASGDMILMQGKTQANWQHSIPKRKGADADEGRINVTFRKAMIPAGTDNYYRYNVGDGPIYKWDEKKGMMSLWENTPDALKKTSP